MTDDEILDAAISAAESTPSNFGPDLMIKIAVEVARPLIRQQMLQEFKGRLDSVAASTECADTERHARWTIVALDTFASDQSATVKEGE